AHPANPAYPPIRETGPSISPAEKPASRPSTIRTSRAWIPKGCVERNEGARHSPGSAHCVPMSSANAAVRRDRDNRDNPIRPVLPQLEDHANVLEQDEQVVRVGGSRHETKPFVESSRVVVFRVDDLRADASNASGLDAWQHRVLRPH